MPSNVQRQREALGLRFRQLRKDAELSGRALAARLGWPQSKVSKIETGRQSPTRADINAWCAALSRPQEAPDLLRQLRALETLYSEYQQRLRAGMDAAQRPIADIEARATTVRAFDPALVPGLLQTPDYARARITESAAFFGVDPELDEAIARRMQRQAVLYESKRRFHFVLTEAVITYRTAPPDVMAAQIDRLIAASSVRTVRLGIIPFSATPQYAPMHNFRIYDDELARVETVAAALTLTHAEEIATYRRAFDVLAASAVHGGEARRLLTRAAERLDSRS